MEHMIEQCCDKLHINLSYDMPSGYEEANGTYDVCCNTLFLNKQLINAGTPWETSFYLFHELRHAQQYMEAEDVSPDIRESLPYVILYNGVCYKLQGNEWKECRLGQGGADFQDLYLSMPYELDANRYAYEKALELFPRQKEKLRKLYEFFTPVATASMEELRRVFRLIDEKTDNQ